MEWTDYPEVVGDDDGDDRSTDTVTVNHGTLDPEADSYSYQWFRNSTEAIHGATDADYTLTPADADAGYLSVRVTATRTATSTRLRSPWSPSATQTSPRSQR